MGPGPEGALSCQSKSARDQLWRAGFVKTIFFQKKMAFPKLPFSPSSTEDGEKGLFEWGGMIWEISILFNPPTRYPNSGGIPLIWGTSGGGVLWEKLSNSGNTLKLMIPSYIWNYINGWSNYSCMVTRDKIQETRIGNRGSKSIALFFLLRKLSAKRALCSRQCYCKRATSRW